MKGGLGDLTNSNDSNHGNNQQQPVERKQRKQTAEDLLDRFAIRTGLEKLDLQANNDTINHRSSSRRRRYLWTDAFALANYTNLNQDKEKRPSGEATIYQEYAMHLIDAVHETLGKHRLDHKEPQKAGIWLPNASDEHPTSGGLRIGKPKDERPPNLPCDIETEWDKDGQYFHYLTKWATALDMITRKCGNTKYTKWAMELLQVASSKFVTHQYGRPQMYWKLSIELDRPQVASQGARDALEGYILATRLIGTCEECQIFFSPLLPSMFNLQRIFHSMIHVVESNDPLELGGMLLDMCQLCALQKQMGSDDHRKTLLNDLQKAVLSGLESIVQTKELEGPPDERTPFRELGLSLGLRAAERVLLDESNNSSPSFFTTPPLPKLQPFEEILVYLPVAEQIETYWMDPEHKSTKSWRDHLDMNDIMLASTLNPSCWSQ
ncbi:MAG: hypothetical protein SGBAC_004953 [Bacillariaceae sp.]